MAYRKNALPPPKKRYSYAQFREDFRALLIIAAFCTFGISMLIEMMVWQYIEHRRAKMDEAERRDP